MKINLGSIAITGMAMLVNANSLAAPVTQQEVQRAQGEMVRRVDDAVNRYAGKIKLQGYASYCYTELALRTNGLPADGLVPYGVNYFKITDSVELTQVLSVREAYETSFLILCLANAKNALREAERP